MTQSKIEERRSVAQELVARYKALIAALPADGDMTPDDVLRIAASTINEAHPKLFPNAEARAGAVAGQLLNKFNLRSEAGVKAVLEFGAYFANLYPDDVSAYAPGSRRLELIRSVFLVAVADKMLSVSDLASKLDGELQTNRALIKADIKAGRLQAEKIGNQYVIKADAAAEWLANPVRGSRAK